MKLFTSTQSLIRPSVESACVMPHSRHKVVQTPILPLKDQYQAVSRAQSPLFSGRYSPSDNSMTLLKQTLTGWRDNPGMTGPSFFVEGESGQLVTQALRAFLEAPKEARIPEEAVKALSKVRAQVSNLYAVYLDRPARSPEHFESEARTYLETLKTQVTDLKQIFQTHYSFQKAEQRILLSVIAQTAPTLFAMGFPDAAAHCSQVCKLALYMAAEERGRPLELLQSAIVGWLHDPKLSTDVSFANLATHPAVAGALANAAFEIPLLKRELKNYFQALGKPAGQKSFKNGIIDALPLNNDSRWVVANAILPDIAGKVETEYGRGPAEDIRRLMMARFECPSKGQKPKPLPGPLVKILEKIQLDTGLVGIRTAALDKNTAKLLNAIINGIETRPEVVSGMHRTLKNKDCFVNIQVSALSMFCHHDEVIPSGKVAALALVNSDPRLLSPHKVLLASKPDGKFSDHLKSFANSFNDNIQDLPRNSQASARVWQRAIYISVLKAADRLTGAKHLESFLQENRSNAIDKQVQNLRQILASPGTWGDYASITGYDEKFKVCVAQIEASYIEMCRAYREARFRHDGSIYTIR